jgi:hypothetical protein
MTTKDQLGILTEQISANTLKESTTSGDSASFSALILPLIEKIYSESFITQVADTQPLKGPTGRVAALYATYGGTGNSAETNTHPDSSYILILTGDATATLTPLVDGSPQSLGGSTFIVRYFETDTTKKIAFAASQGQVGTQSNLTITRVLLSRESGTYVPATTDTFAALPIKYVTNNKAGIKKLFQAYSGSYGYTNDSNTTVKKLGFETRTNMVETVARKLKSKFSTEQIQELLDIYKVKGESVAAEFIGTEIRHEIDKEFIEYMKFISKYTVLPTTQLSLSNSVAAYASGAIQDISSDLAMNIFLAAEQIVRDTRRNRTIFILADPITIAILQVNALMTKAVAEEENPYRVGKLGSYELFVDLFAEPNEHFIIVGYQGSNEGDGDSGIIFAPYSNTVHTAVDADLHGNMMLVNRYALVRHPQDTGNKNQANIWDAANAGNSDFFKMFIVDFGNFIPNLTDTTLPNFE